MAAEVDAVRSDCLINRPIIDNLEVILELSRYSEVYVFAMGLRFSV